MALGVRGSNGKTYNQDYTNLLFTDSESDSRIPDLKLPPVKGKKQKKKRGGMMYRQEEASCGIGSVIKGFLIIVLLTAFVALAGMSFWSLRKINSLQDTVDRLQQSDAFTPDSMTKFQTQLVSLDKSLSDLRSGDGGTNSLAASIKELRTKVKTFEDTSVELKNQLATSKDLFDLPKKISDVTSVVATLENDLSEAGEKQKKLESRLDELEKQLSVTQSPGEATNDAAVPNEQLADRMKLLNLTMIQNFAQIKGRLSGLEANTSTMEDFIKKSASEMSSFQENINKLIQSAIGSAMTNITGEALPSEEMRGMMKNLGEQIQKLQAATPQENVVSEGDFLLFKESVMDDVKHVNDTMISFNDELKEISTQFSTLNSSVKNISDVIMTVVSKVLDKKVEENTSTTKSTSPPQVETSSVKDISDGADADHDGEGTVIEGGVDNTTLLHLDNVTDINDLHAAFLKISPLGKPLTRDGLNALQGDLDLPEEKIEAIDLNRDGSFSELELAQAMGIVPPD